MFWLAAEQVIQQATGMPMRPKALESLTEVSELVTRPNRYLTSNSFPSKVRVMCSWQRISSAKRVEVIILACGED